MAIENNQIQNMNTDNDEISLKELIIKIKEWVGFLKTKWKTIFIAGIIGALIGLTISLLVKPSYKAVTTFAMEEDKSGGGAGLSSAIGIASSFGIDLGGAGGGGAFAATNLAELMKSRLLVEKVLLEPITVNGKIISLLDYYIQFSGLRKKWKNKSALKNIQFIPGADPAKFSIQQDSIIREVHKDLIEKDNLSITQKDKKVTILFVEVNSENELFSKIFCENLAKETSNFYIETKSKKAKINVDILQKQVDSVRNSLDGAISSVASETDNVYNMNPAFNIKGTPSKKKQIDVTANTAILTNLAVQLELAKITLRKETPLIQLIDSPIYPLEKEKYGILMIVSSAFLSGFLTVLYFFVGKLYKNLIS